MSTSDAHAEETLGVVAAECVARSVSFKFIATRSSLLTRNAKYADRSGSGKFITIYPADDFQLAELAEALNDRLAHIPHPYILSDVRHRNGPVFFRYGGFRQITVSDDWGTPASVIPTCGGGTRADLRSATFITPQDAAVPPIVAAAIATYLADDPSPLDEYTSIAPLHFSNSGGVYKAVDLAGGTTLLREARPHAGLDFRGRDAVTRLTSEHIALKSLEHLGIAPRPLRSFRAWEHEFLESEFLEGATLSEWTARNYPFHRQNASDAVQYAAAAKHILRGLESAVTRVHDAGFVIGDIHPGNIMVNAVLDVRLIDLEDSRPSSSTAPAGFNVLGYRAPDCVGIVQADWFAVSRCAASMFVIDFALEILAPSHWPRVLRRIRDEFGDVCDLIEELCKRCDTGTHVEMMYRPTATVTAPLESRAAERPDYRDMLEAIVAGIHETRTRDRLTRFPGDIAQHRGLGLWNFTSGSSGVFLALSRAGVTVAQADIDELVLVSRLVERGAWGLFDGMSGVACTLHELGARDEALRIYRAAGTAASSMHRADLHGGLAGIGLALTASAETNGSAELLEVASNIGRTLTARLFSAADSRSRRSLARQGGLLYGWSGAGLFLADLARVTGQEGFAARAHALVQRDVDQLVEGSTGSLGVLDEQGKRALPYLEAGSAGVLIAIRAVRGLPGYASAFDETVPGLVRACSSHTYAFSGLLRGRAGMLPALASVEGATRSVIDRHISQLMETSLHWRETLQFAGENYLRLSADVSTGSAGVLAALLCAQGNARAWLPVIQTNELDPQSRIDS